MEELSLKVEEKDKPTLPLQAEPKREVAKRIWDAFDDLRNQRDKTWAYFRERTLVDYMNDSNSLFNNYRTKPAWKDEWQSNVSDMTVHAKLMAVAAKTVANRVSPEITPRFDYSRTAQYKAGIISDIDRYINSEERNGDIDYLFTVLRALREGTCISYRDYKKTELYDKTDQQFVALEDFYPGNIGEFRMEDQTRAVWRSVIMWSEFVEHYQNNSAYMDTHLVQSRMNICDTDEEYFKVSKDIGADQVEILRFFDILTNEFFIVAGGVLIKDATMTGTFASCQIAKNKRKLPFAKAVYESYSDKFFYGRSFPDVLRDHQEAIDFTFNNMFDRNTMNLLKPIFVGSEETMADDYWYPNRIIPVRDAQQIKTLDIDAPDITAFRILQELRSAEDAGTIDPIQQGQAPGRRTKFEVEAANEASDKISSLFTMMMKDYIIQQTKLSIGIIIKHYIKSSRSEPFIIKNAKFMSGKTGTKIVKITNKPTPSNFFGFSHELQLEAKLASTPQDEKVIIEVKPSAFKNLELGIKISANARPEMSQAFKRAMIDRLSLKYLSMPELFDPKAVAQMDVENNRDILGEHADNILVKEDAKKSPLQELQEATGARGNKGADQGNTLKTLASQPL